MEVNRFKLRGKKGIELSVFRIAPEEDVKGVVHILHGMGEHKERYLHFAKYLESKGYAVYAHDHRKHGDSVSDESQVGIFTKEDKWEDMVDDCNFINRQIKKDFPDIPIITLGHSMGSMIARKYLSKFPNSSTLAIIMGTLPPISFGKAFVPLFLSTVMSLFNKNDNRSPFMGKLLNDPMIKDFEPRRTDFDWITIDEKNVDKYIEDPLCGYNYSTRFYKEFFIGLVNANKSDVIFEGKNIPLLFISGKNDPVGDYGEGVKATRELYSGHGFLDLTMNIVNDARHEILNEKNKKETYKFIFEWIEESLEKVKTELD